MSAPGALFAAAWRKVRSAARELVDPPCPYGDWRSSECIGCYLDRSKDGYAEPVDHTPLRPVGRRAHLEEAKALLRGRLAHHPDEGVRVLNASALLPDNHPAVVAIADRLERSAAA